MTAADRLPLDTLMELATPLLREAFDDMPPEQAAVTALGGRIRAEVERIYTAGQADLRDLLSDLADFGVDPCRYDHHGFCQEHGWMATEPRCPYARAKELLGGADRD